VAFINVARVTVNKQTETYEKVIWTKNINLFHVFEQSKNWKFINWFHNIPIQEVTRTRLPCVCLYI